MVDKQGTDEGLRELALFAGAGGGILGGKLLGWRTVCAVELNTYAASVLLQRQNDGCLPAFPVWDDVCTFDGRPWRGIVDIISGGFPCQDISAAGKGAGITGERSGLWKEFVRIISEVRPRFVFVENSPVLTSRGIDTVLGDLAALGYDAEWGVLGAVDAGAPHQRHRIWIMAYTAGAQNNRERGNCKCGWLPMGRGEPSTFGNNRKAYNNSPCRCRENVADPKSINSRTGLRQNGQECYGDQPCDCGRNGSDSMRQGLSQWQGKDTEGSRQKRRPIAIGSEWWQSEPDVGRVAHGVAARVDRLKAIGNGQVPAVAKLAWEILTGGK